MSSTLHNPRKAAKYPPKFSQRENKASTSNFSCLESSDATVTVTTTSPANFVKLTLVGAQTCKLPPAAENAGRCITVMSDNGGDLIEAADQIEGNPNFALDTAGEWADCFCTGSTWIIVRGNLT